ncbi:MAG TPA: hypothetical protein VHX44_14820, partial [Planctomycetota bacterium]|nr:hypothetical protein [Planctomycetota bacterium]
MTTAVRWILLVVLIAVLVVLCWMLALAGKATPDSALAGPWVRYGGRVALVAAALGAWFITQKLIGSRAPLAEGTIGDLVHDLTAPVNRWLHAHPRAADRLLMGSSFGIDTFGLALIGSGLLG